jgi:hypothetical protein
MAMSDLRKPGSEKSRAFLMEFDPRGVPFLHLCRSVNGIAEFGLNAKLLAVERKE